MSKLLLDTNILNHLLKGHQQVTERLSEAIEAKSVFLLGSPAHYELSRYLDLKGAYRLIRIYQKLTSSWQRCELTFEDWTVAARIWAEQHRIGRGISDMDLLLATLALREDAVVVTANVRHFDGLGVQVADWTA